MLEHMGKMGWRKKLLRAYCDVCPLLIGPVKNGTKSVVQTPKEHSNFVTVMKAWVRRQHGPLSAQTMLTAYTEAGAVSILLQAQLLS